MNVLRLALPIVLVGGLAACASTSESPNRVGAAPPAGSLGADEAYVARVEQIARTRNIDVRWINPPLRRDGQRR